MPSEDNIGIVLSTLPVADLDDIVGYDTVMILAPHPDDETLGCGGLIAELCNQGRQPIVVIMTDGTASHPSSVSYPPFRLRNLRECEARTALKELGLSHERLYFLRLRDSNMPKSGRPYRATVAEIGRIFQSHWCGTLLAPWLYDSHCDHEMTQLMARTVATQLKVRLLSYPVWGWLLPSRVNVPTTAVQGMRLDISTSLTAKLRAIESYRSQYTDLIADDPKAFRLPDELLSIFKQPFEVFLQTMYE